MLLIENAKELIQKKCKNNKIYNTWVFECNVCGKDINAQAGKLKTHSGKCRRCTQLGEPYMFIFNELKNHRNHKVPFNLTYEDILTLVGPNKSCHYCGVPLIYHKHSKDWGTNNSRAHQLDRKDNNKGYDLENVVNCCWDCNRLKSDRFTYEEFIKLSPILKQIMEERYATEHIEDYKNAAEDEQ